MISSKIKILKLDFRVIFFYLQAISILKPDIYETLEVELYPVGQIETQK